MNTFVHPCSSIDYLQVNATETEHQSDTTTTTTPPTAEPLPEIEMYTYLLCILLLVDAKQWPDARTLSTAAIDRATTFNRRTLDTITARIYFYFSWSAENMNALADVRSTLHALYRTAVLHHDDVGQETLLNLLLRNYIQYNLYEQAEALRAKAQRDTYRTSYQHSRMLYYQGRIRAVQLEYSDARDALTQAIRKAPSAAWAFKAAATKWLVVVRLLLGEIPERSELSSPELRGTLAPYLPLVQAVRRGDVAAFAAAAASHAGRFAADGTKHLVARLRANVIRAGLRRIATAYSRISLADVASKLGLPSTEDAEFIIIKAIRDGGISARVNHEEGVMVAKTMCDVYTTDEPLAAFHARIAFCMDVHNEAQRAMRYEARKQREWDDANELRERQDQELQAALDDDDEMDF